MSGFCGQPTVKEKSMMGFYKRRAICLSAALMLLATTFSLPAPAPAQEGQKTEIAFWHYFSEEQAKPLKELLARFEQQNPDIKVNAYYQGFPPQLRQKLDASFATSPANNPVLSTVYENWTSAYVDKGLMEPVENYVGTPEGLTPESVQDIVRVYRENNSWKGKLVTMPFAKSIYLQYLNMDLLAEAGLTTAPKTLTEYKSMIEKAVQRDGSRTKVYGAGVQPLSEAFTTLYFASGGELFDDQGNPAFDNPQAVEVLNLLKGLMRPTRNIYVNTDYMSTPFANQQIASYIYSSASFPYNEKGSRGKFRYEVSPIPGKEGTETKYLMQGMNLGIFANRPESEKKAAMRLVKFLTNTENAVFWETRTGYMPIRYSVLQNPEMQKYMAEHPHYALASSLVLADKGKQEPKLAEWDGIRTELGTVVDRVINRGADPQKELTALKQRVAKRLKKK